MPHRLHHHVVLRAEQELRAQERADGSAREHGAALDHALDEGDVVVAPPVDVRREELVVPVDRVVERLRVRVRAGREASRRRAWSCGTSIRLRLGPDSRLGERCHFAALASICAQW
ncbi:MAG: hypothetical protein R3F14_05950 [Polyangiaceae bacterium]